MPASTRQNPRAEQPAAASHEELPLPPSDSPQGIQRALFLAGLEQVIAAQRQARDRSIDLAEQAKARGDLDTAERLLALAEQSTDIIARARRVAISLVGA